MTHESEGRDLIAPGAELMKEMEKHLEQLITPEDIRKIMTGYGESLPDLGAEYCQEFLDWFKVSHADIYQKWNDDFQKDEDSFYKLDDEEIAETLLFEYSNSSLRGILSTETHDKYLAEFTNQNPKAHQHIKGLLKRLQ